MAFSLKKADILEWVVNMEATLKKIIDDATSAIKAELGIDSVTGQDIEQKVVEIVEETGSLDVNEIVQTFLDNPNHVSVHLE